MSTYYAAAFMLCYLIWSVINQVGNNIYTLQMRKLRVREIKQTFQGHATSKNQSGV